MREEKNLLEFNQWQTVLRAGIDPHGTKANLLENHRLLCNADQAKPVLLGQDRCSRLHIHQQFALCIYTKVFSWG